MTLLTANKFKNQWIQSLCSWIFWGAIWIFQFSESVTDLTRHTHFCKRVRSNQPRRQQAYEHTVRICTGVEFVQFLNRYVDIVVYRKSRLKKLKKKN